MGFIITVLTVFLIIDCILLVGIILLQRGKGQGLAGAFGVGGMEEALGARAATTAQKITVVLAVGFLTLSIALGLLRNSYDSAIPSVAPASKHAPAPAAGGPTSGKPASGAASGAGESK